MPVRDPIVLVHGILGFDRIALPLGALDYFREVRNALRAAGNQVPEPPRLDPAGTIEDRAEGLKQYLDDRPELGRVHLIAHSMGGLDSRFMISRLGMAGRVTSLTTIGTPHKGTPLADGRLLQDLQPVLAALNQHGIDIRGFLDLTPAAAQGFEADAPDAVAVRYFSVAGHYFPGLLDLLKAPHDLMRLHGAGDNDGLVPVASATHGERLGVWAVNHFRLVNWATNLLIPPIELLQSDVLDGYLGIVDALSARGL